jgi:hypothetical protein
MPGLGEDLVFLVWRWLFLDQRNPFEKKLAA